MSTRSYLPQVFAANHVRRFAIFVALFLSIGCRFGNSHPHPKNPEQAAQPETTVSSPEELFLRYESDQAKSFPRGVQALLKSSPSLVENPKETAAPKASPTPHPLGHPKAQHPLKGTLLEELSTANKNTVSTGPGDKITKTSSKDSVKTSAAAKPPAQIAAQVLPDPVPTTPSGGYGDTPAPAASAAPNNSGAKETTPEPEKDTAAVAPGGTTESNPQARARLKDSAGAQSGLFSRLFSTSGNTLVAELAVLLLLVVLFFVALWMRLDKEFGKKP